MKAEAGKFISTGEGNVFDAYVEGHVVGDYLNKNGSLAKNRTQRGSLPYWRKWWRGGEWELGGGSVARYDPETEAAANELREHIRTLRHQLDEAKDALAALYEYQAGPKPEPEEVRT